MRKSELETEKMALKRTRAESSKEKELESFETPLVKRLKNIKDAKVQETSWAHIWAEIKEWAYENARMTTKGEKINHNTIMKYMNTPFIVSFGGTKEMIVKFIINRYHNGNLTLTNQ